MTDTTELSTETLANRIAARGRDALVGRLRTAYGDAANAHADIVTLSDERIEALVQSAADRADGLQWRRALAGVGAEELGVTLTQAHSHPAVARAQALVGAPSYEQSLAELIARPIPPPAPPKTGNGALATDYRDEPQHAPADQLEPASEPEDPPVLAPEAPSAHTVAGALVPEDESPAAELGTAAEFQTPTDELETAAAFETPADDLEPSTGDLGPTAGDLAAAAAEFEPAEELERITADDVVFELLPEPEPVEMETELYETIPDYTEEEPPASFEAESFLTEAGSEVLQVPAIHLGGVANLPTRRDGLTLRLSANGLDIVGEGEIIGRLVWSDIDALEVPHLRARRRREQLRARLVVRTPHGDASFEIPGLSADELRDRIEPLISRYGRR